MSHRFLQIPQEHTWKEAHTTKFVLREKPKISHKSHTFFKKVVKS